MTYFHIIPTVAAQFCHREIELAEKIFFFSYANGMEIQQYTCKFALTFLHSNSADYYFFFELNLNFVQNNLFLNSNYKCLELSYLPLSQPLDLHFLTWVMSHLFDSNI